MFLSDTDPRTESVAPMLEVLASWPWQSNLPSPRAGSLSEAAASASTGPITAVAYRFVEPVYRVFDPRCSWRELAFWVFGGLWNLATWAFFGAAITRIAVVRLGRSERVGLVEALRFACKRYGAYLAGPLMPTVAVAALAVGPLALGWIMRVNPGVVLAAVLWPVVLVFALLMGLLLLGLLFGWPLMWATVSAEGGESFDGISSAYAYTYQRPLQYLCYALVAAALGWLGWLLVAWLAESVIGLAWWSIGWGTGQERLNVIRSAVAGGSANEGLAGTLWAGAGLIGFFENVVRMAVWGFVFSYFWCAASAIYLLLRRHNDGTEMDEVFIEDEQKMTLGLPTLETDPQGVPGVTDEPPPPGDSTPPPPLPNSG